MVKPSHRGLAPAVLEYADQLILFHRSHRALTRLRSRLHLLRRWAKHRWSVNDVRAYVELPPPEQDRRLPPIPREHDLAPAVVWLARDIETAFWYVEWALYGGLQVDDLLAAQQTTDLLEARLLVRIEVFRRRLLASPPPSPLGRRHGSTLIPLPAFAARYIETYRDWYTRTGERPRQLDVAAELALSESTFRRYLVKLTLAWPPL